MQKREYIVDCKYIQSLSDFIKTFGWFYSIAGNHYPDLLKRDINIPFSNEEIKEMYENNKDYIDESLDRLNDYVWEMANPFNGGIGKDDWILIRILNSEHLKEVLGREYTEKYIENIIKYLEEKSLVELGGKNFTEEERQKRIEFQYLRLKGLKGYVRNLTLFDELMLDILEVKKVRLQLQ